MVVLLACADTPSASTAGTEEQNMHIIHLLFHWIQFTVPMTTSDDNNTRLLPSTFMMNRPLALMNAIRLPSGDRSPFRLTSPRRVSG